jgi:putative effector of murein hydrolase
MAREKRRKPTTEELLHGGYKEPFTAKDLVREIIIGIITMAFAGGWVFLMLMIISFVTLSYLQFHFKRMVIASIVCGILAGILYVVATVKKYKKYYNS